MTTKEKFKVSIQTFTRREQNEHVYKILKKHPEGLTYKELTFYAGISDYNCLKKILNRLVKQKTRNSVYIRNIGYIKLVYARIHAKKIPKDLNSRNI